MWFWSKKNANKHYESKEAQINKLKKSILEEAEKASEETKKVNAALDIINKDTDITLHIFMATGGDKRSTK